MSAWIEIVICGGKGTVWKRVALYVSAWIEITRSLA
ncbi:hypothetical protein HPL003_18820 [Paenibacillus terrae HPL-003]|uniref:Uncharacterized protein n=1 Tax=Paenibacillus terrae (strain HPL-003) TaxID=985665 RepID=G7W4V6_PAETH|nr:hypothetical protein HPL003_18820 [Paenibacillus terrae HPL-003]